MSQQVQGFSSQSLYFINTSLAADEDRAVCFPNCGDNTVQALVELVSVARGKLHALDLGVCADSASHKSVGAKKSWRGHAQFDIKLHKHGEGH